MDKLKSLFKISWFKKKKDVELSTSAEPILAGCPEEYVEIPVCALEMNTRLKLTEDLDKKGKRLKIHQDPYIMGNSSFSCSPADPRDVPPMPTPGSPFPNLPTPPLPHVGSPGFPEPVLPPPQFGPPGFPNPYLPTLPPHPVGPQGFQPTSQPHPP